MARPRKPVEKLKQQGNFREDRHGQKVELTPVDSPVTELSNPGVPERPTSLHETGIQLWDTIFLSPAASWIQPSDMPVVVLACQQADMQTWARERFMVTHDPADMRASNQALDQLIRLLSLLGLSPSDRARMGIQIAKTKSTLQSMMDRRSGTSG